MTYTVRFTYFSPARRYPSDSVAFVRPPKNADSNALTEVVRIFTLLKSLFSTPNKHTEDYHKCDR